MLDDEKREIWARMGKLGVVTEIDRYGYFWLGFGETYEELDGTPAYGVNSSFCVSRECWILVHEPEQSTGGQSAPSLAI